jgi:hypothetical protein
MGDRTMATSIDGEHRKKERDKGGRFLVKGCETLVSIQESPTLPICHIPCAGRLLLKSTCSRDHRVHV